MRTRRHHNNDGRQQIKMGRTREQVRAMAARLGLNYGQRDAAVRPPEQLITAEKEPRATASQGLGGALAGMSRRVSPNTPTVTENGLVETQAQRLVEGKRDGE